MENKHANLLINVHHPFWLELRNYRKNIFQFRKKESFSALLNRLDDQVNEHNDAMKKLYFVDSKTFDFIYNRNVTFLDDQIKKRENFLTKEYFTREIRILLEMYRPKFENVLPEISINYTNPEFKDFHNLSTLQIAMVYDFYFLNPNPEVKKWMEFEKNRNLVLAYLFNVDFEGFRNSLSKYKRKSGEMMTSKTITSLKKEKIFHV